MVAKNALFCSNRREIKVLTSNFPGWHGRPARPFWRLAKSLLTTLFSNPPVPVTPCGKATALIFPVISNFKFSIFICQRLRCLRSPSREAGMVGAGLITLGNEPSRPTPRTSGLSLIRVHSILNCLPLLCHRPPSTLRTIACFSPPRNKYIFIFATSFVDEPVMSGKLAGHTFNLPHPSTLAAFPSSHGDDRK